MGRFSAWQAFLIMAWIPSTLFAQRVWLPAVEPGGVTVQLETLATGLSGNDPVFNRRQFAPTDLVSANDGSGRLFVSTQGGVIRLVGAEGQLRATPFLDTNHADTDIDRFGYGMTSLVFHPGFADPTSPGSGKFYTLTTEREGAGVADFSESLVVNLDQIHQDVITEWTVDDIQADTFSGTSRVLLRVDQPGRDHNLNDLAFDHNGYLYISSGDGNNTGRTTDITFSDNAQTLANIFGKILRVDPFGTNGVNGQYGVPGDNPFVGQDGAVEEIYAYGLRNPYRIGFDRETGDLYAGVVGQINIEWVSKIDAGKNYGWNLKEGGFIFDKNNFNNLTQDMDADGNGNGDFADANGLVDPLFQYDHTQGHSVAGGFVYRGSLMPQLYGKYIFGDFNPSSLFYGDLETGQIQKLLIDGDGAALMERIYSIGEDEFGELYVMGGPNTGNDGVVLRIVPEPMSGVVLAIGAAAVALMTRRRLGSY